MASTDIALLARWQNHRDAEAFRALALRHGPRVLATCRRVLGDAAEAEDVTQECFELLARGGRGPSAHVGAWLHKVATRRAIDRIRRDQRRRARDERFAADQDGVGEVVWDDVYAFVDEAMAALPEKLRGPLVAHFIEGRTQADIARDSGMHRRTVGNRIARGVELIRKRLRRQGIPVGGTALAAMMTAHLAEAATLPSALEATLGKLALAGVKPTAASTAAILGGTLIMKKVVVGAAVLAGLLFGGVLLRDAMREEESAPPVAREAAVAMQTPTAAEPVESAAQEEEAGAVDSVMPPASGTVHVAGRVVDKNGVLVSGAQVGARSREAASVARVYTNSEGGFAISMSFPSEVVLRAAKGSYESAATAPLKLADGGVEDIVLVLDQLCRGSISGVVVDALGRPVKRAPVVLSRGGDSLNGGLIDFPGTISGAGGGFRISGLAADSYGVFVLAAGMEVPSPEDEQVRVALKKDESLEGVRLIAPSTGKLRLAGRVVNTLGVPLQGAAVILWRFSEREETRTDQWGRFSFEGLEEGTYSVGADHHEAGYGYADLEATPAGTEDIELVLLGLASVEGQVVRADTGAPIPEFELFYSPGMTAGALARFSEAHLFHEGYLLLNGRQVKDADGRFTLADKHAGDLAVSAQAPGFAPSFQHVFVEEFQTATGVKIRLQPSVRIEGVIVDDEGAPVPGAYLFLERIPHPGIIEDSALTQSNQEGRFSLSNVLPDVKQVCVSHPGFAPACVPIQPNMQIVLQPSGALQGVVTIGGVPMKNAEILLNSMSGVRFIPPSGKTGSDGAYSISGLPEGRARVQVYASDLPERMDIIGPMERCIEAEVDLEFDAVATADFDFTSGTSIVEGYVAVDGEFFPKSDILLLVTTSVGKERFMGVTDAEGFFQFRDVPAGWIELTAKTGVHSEIVSFSLVEGEHILQQFDLR